MPKILNLDPYVFSDVQGQGSKGRGLGDREAGGQRKEQGMARGWWVGRVGEEEEMEMRGADRLPPAAMCPNETGNQMIPCNS